MTISPAMLLVALGMIAQGPAVPPGDATINGRVLDGVTRQPIAGTLITLNTVDLKKSLVTESDSRGTYAFEAIAAGEYRVTAKHPDYVVQTFGLQDLRMSEVIPDGVIRVERGQTQTVGFALARGGTISGRITTHDGQPLNNANVSMIATQVTSGNRLMGATSARTNASGQYEIANIPEGTYVVMAMPLGPQAPGERSIPDYRPTYFPGTQSQPEATQLRIGASDRLRNIDFSLAVTDLLRISGHVIRGSAQGPIRAYLVSAGNTVRAFAVQEDGAFTIAQLKPGDYTLVASAEGDAGAEAGTISLNVTSEMSGVLLGLTATGTINGRVVTNDGSVPAGLYLAAVLAKDGEAIDPVPRDRVEVGNDGTFMFSAMFGERVLRTGAGDAWDIDRILVGKATVTSLTVQAGQRVDDVVVVLKRR